MPLDGGNLPRILIKDRREGVLDGVTVSSTSPRHILNEHRALDRKRRERTDEDQRQNKNGTSAHVLPPLGVRPLRPCLDYSHYFVGL
jgi:hypothetical protein